MIDLESLETPYVVPLMMNCKRDNEHLISSTIPFAIQANATFLVDVDKLPTEKTFFVMIMGLGSQMAAQRNFTLSTRMKMAKFTLLRGARRKRRETLLCAGGPIYVSLVLSTIRP